MLVIVTSAASEPQNNEDMKLSFQYQQQFVMEKMAHVNFTSSHVLCESCQLAFQILPPTLVPTHPYSSARVTLLWSKSDCTAHVNLCLRAFAPVGL